MVATGRDAAAFLRAHGLRVTPQRVAVVRALRGHSHPTAEDVWEAVTHQQAGMSPATVYNALGRLEAAGVLTVIFTPEGRRYDLKTEPHEHIQCLSCGRLDDLPPLGGGRDWLDASVPEGWEQAGWHLMVEGLCPDCRGTS
jgi:Fe2+ or Zn2+ uptake regulation protein